MLTFTLSYNAKVPSSLRHIVTPWPLRNLTPVSLGFLWHSRELTRLVLP